MPTATEVRANFRAALDDAEHGITVPVRRGGRTAAMIDGERLRNTLQTLIDPDVQVFCEDGEWNAFVPRIPSISATGDSFEELVTDLVTATREYADDWNDHLKSALNHSDNWGFVQVVILSDDNQLRDWLVP